MIRTYKPKVARAEEDFDQDPVHLPERKGTACEEPKSCVEAFLMLALAHGMVLAQYEPRYRTKTSPRNLIKSLVISFKHGSSVPKYGWRLSREQILAKAVIMS